MQWTEPSMADGGLVSGYEPPGGIEPAGGNEPYARRARALDMRRDRCGRTTVDLSPLTVDLPPLTVAEGPDALWFLEIQDEQGVRRCPLPGRCAVVGSSPACDIVVADPAVSGRHCLLSVDAGCVRVQDVGSRNGTFIGAARVADALAASGTTLVLGRSTLSVHLGDGDDDEEEAAAEPLPGLAGRSRCMLRVAALVRRLARLTAPVLISGESGTGKEHIARALHALGPRRDRPYIAVNVASLPRELIESEMFGHERGAFTGAVGRRAGAFEEAEGGTLFLDEIGELPLDAQPKLLRALDGYEVRRVGSAGSGRRFDVRLVAATHVRLAERVADGLFRRDLFHRLEVFVIEVPPLRDRRGDIPAIARTLLRQARGELGVDDLTSHATARLVAHDWPGNVRELRNVLYRAADAARGKKLLEGTHVDAALRSLRGTQTPLVLTPDMAWALFERHRRNLSAAARAAGYPRTSFRKLLARSSRAAEAGALAMEAVPPSDGGADHGGEVGGEP